MARSKTPPATTCQICGGRYKANNKAGVIAHHGYTRPHRGSGWQTSSCYGARHLPYEVSCDALPPAIKSLEAHIARAQARHDEIMVTAPETLDYYKHSYGGRHDPDKRVVVPRPDGFDPKTARRSYRSGSYDTLFFDLVYELAQDVKASTSTLEYLRKRLADWKPVQVAIHS